MSSQNLYDLLNLTPDEEPPGASATWTAPPASPAPPRDMRVQSIPDNIDLDPKAVRMISPDENCVGIRLTGNALLVAFAALPSQAEISRIEQMIGMPVAVGLASNARSLSLLRNRVATILNIQSEVCEHFLDRALEARASDLHLSVGSVPKIRVGGRLQSMAKEEIVTDAEIREVMNFLIRADLMELFPIRKDADCAATYAGWRLRIAAYHQQGSPAVAVRVIPRDIVGVEELGLPPITSRLALDHSSGLVLVCGITGSGKSTTLAAMIDLINSQKNCHIITVEDPIEYIHTEKMATIHQREIGPDTPGFLDALTHALRQDPDVILVGEMRNPETMRMAMDAAETGHLVFATVHSRDSASVVNRIVSSFPAEQQEHMRTQLAEALVGVVVQKLVPAGDGQGRHVACEIMTNTPAVREMIRKDTLHQLHNVVDTSAEFGMQTFDRDLARLVASGKVNPESVRAHIMVPSDFARHMEAMTSSSQPQEKYY